jgi:hypothetical protein
MNRSHGPCGCREKRQAPYVERRTITYPTNLDKDGSLSSLERLRHIMFFPKLGYGSLKIAVHKVNSKTRYPKPFE